MAFSKCNESCSPSINCEMTSHLSDRLRSCSGAVIFGKWLQSDTERYCMFCVGMETRLHISHCSLPSVNACVLSLSDVHAKYSMCMQSAHTPLPFSVVLFLEGGSTASGSSFCPSERRLLSSHSLTSSLSLFFFLFNFFFILIESPASFRMTSLCSFISEVLREKE